ncbi:hypothetical protein ILYODFUR_004492 [Ilyodon furcidens]|uniref:Uncharacterized protein n=1 Tax=Ilyodon furcidens TaxID=33524 RepID=A0ABV0UHD5_9TELE
MLVPNSRKDVFYLFHTDCIIKDNRSSARRGCLTLIFFYFFCSLCFAPLLFLRFLVTSFSTAIPSPCYPLPILFAPTLIFSLSIMGSPWKKLSSCMCGCVCVRVQLS